jgi:hypothetical protein
MLELQNFPKMKDFSACFAKDFGNFCFLKITSTSRHNQPPPVANIFRKNFCFPENFLGGALEWKEAQILEYTPQPETGWHGPS